MKTLKSFFCFLFEDVVSTNNRFLFVTWCAAVTLIIMFGFVLNSESVSILGLAESQELQVNFDSAVEIKEVHVLPGQIVKKGDLLLELNQENLKLQIHTLKSHYDKLAAELKLRRQMSSLTQDMTQLPRGTDPLQVEIGNIKHEIEILEKRMRNLFVFAEIDGAVGSVNFKNGEQAPAFASLVTLVPLNPTYVNGYVNENLRATVEIGQTVEVFSDGGKSVYGRIVNVGSRIVPIPSRLLRIQTLQAWGREVVVKIPAKNNFLVGEKVNVRKAWGLSLFSAAQAGEDLVPWKSLGYDLKKINFPDVITNQFNPEVSGLAFLPELKKFALISDDYPESRPLVLLMDEKGEVSEQMLPIEGLEEMKDIESISLDGPYMYLLSSLSVGKNNFLKKSRQLLAKIRREGLSLILEDSIDIRKILLRAMENSADADLRKIAQLVLQSKNQDLEIEGHYVKNNELFVSLKQPLLLSNLGVVLKISALEKIFQQKIISASEVSVAYKFNFILPERKVNSYLTDIINVEDTVYVASTCIDEKCSAIWKLKEGSQDAELIYEFNEKKLEGIAISPKDKQIFGVFDHKHSKFVTIPYISVKGPE